jgi:hypothetical protein
MISNKFFTKLNLDFSDVEFDGLKLTFGKSYTNDNGAESVIVNWTEDEFQDCIRSKFPKSFRSWIRSVRITFVTESPPPHRDHGGFVCINYYLETGDGPTTFWTANPDAVPTKALGQHTANKYQTEDLNKECSFVAVAKDCYLLNIGEVHTVTIEKNSVRKIMQLTFNPDVTYNVVLDRLTELNLIEEIK